MTLAIGTQLTNPMNTILFDTLSSAVTRYSFMTALGLATLRSRPQIYPPILARLLNRRRVSGFKTQINIHTAVLAELLTAVRSGQYTTLPAPPTSIVLIGHSYGSFMINSLLAANPTIADAAIMTGYSLKGSDTRLTLQGSAPRVARCTCYQFPEI